MLYGGGCSSCHWQHRGEATWAAQLCLDGAAQVEREPAWQSASCRGSWTQGLLDPGSGPLNSRAARDGSGC